MVWTSADLIADVRRRAQLPDAAADGAMTDADILALATEEMSLRIVPLVRSAREDYYVMSVDLAVTSGQALYRIHERAQAGGLRDVTIVTASGDEYRIPRIDVEEIGPAESVGAGLAYVLEGPDIRLVPTPTSSDLTLRMRFHRAHSRFVPNAETSFAVWSGTTLSANAIPSTWSGLISTGLVIDVYYDTSPFGAIALNQIVTSIDPGSGSFEDFTIVGGLAGFNLPTNYQLRVGLSGETSNMDAPRECWPLLISSVTARVLEVIGDTTGAQIAHALVERESPRILSLLSPRSEGGRRVIIDRESALRTRRGRW